MQNDILWVRVCAIEYNSIFSKIFIDNFIDWSNL